MIKYSEEFKQEVVWIVLMSGLLCEWVVLDLGVGKLILNKWVLYY